MHCVKQIKTWMSCGAQLLAASPVETLLSISAQYEPQTKGTHLVITELLKSSVIAHQEAAADLLSAYVDVGQGDWRNLFESQHAAEIEGALNQTGFAGRTALHRPLADAPGDTIVLNGRQQQMQESGMLWILVVPAVLALVAVALGRRHDPGS